MKKIILLLVGCPMFVLAAGNSTPAKTITVATAANKTEAAKKPEEKKSEDQKNVKQTSFAQDVKEFYKSTEKTRTTLKNKALSYYNDTTNSPYFQVGKCTVAGLLVYYGVKQFKSFTVPQQNARMGEFEIGVGNPFAEARPKGLLNFLKDRQNFISWYRDPVTKAGVKILIGNVLLTKQVMEGVSLYQKVVKRYL